MGMFDNCCCCCGLSREASVKVSTYLVILYCLYNVVIEILHFNTESIAAFIISLIINIVILISLILLLIGIKNRKRSYMKQFDTFFIFYVLCAVGFIFYIVGNVISFISFLLSDKENLIEIIKVMSPDDWKKYENLSDDEIKRKIYIHYALDTGFITLFMFLFTYYFFFTRKFVIDTIKEIDNENKNKQLEEGNKV